MLGVEDDLALGQPRSAVNLNGGQDAFESAVREFSAFGMRVTETPHKGSIPYWLVTGRSNPRSWLVPTKPARVSASGWALFQPVLPSARILKSGARLAGRLGLAPWFARHRMYVSGSPAFAAALPKDAHFALFTGTAGPHRKAVVQVMNERGDICAFAKIAGREEVAELLSHEASILDFLEKQRFAGAIYPRVLALGDRAGARVLLTDTVKQGNTATPATPGDMHLEFVNSLVELSPQDPAISGPRFIALLTEALSRLRPGLSEPWFNRLSGALQRIESSSQMVAPRHLAHGDFTPWNCFPHKDKLYVFDWEYAGSDFPLDYDLVHFLMAVTANRPSAARQADAVLSTYQELRSVSLENALAFFLAYLATLSLRYSERAERAGEAVDAWAGAERVAKVFDHVLMRT